MIHTFLKSYRAAHRLTQKEMAAKLGVTREYYSRLERGLASPSFPLFETMCAALKLQAVDLAHLLRDNKEEGMAPPICNLCSRLSRQQQQAIEEMMKEMVSHTGRRR